MFDKNSEIGRAMRATFQNVINSQVVEFSAHEMDLGLYYYKGLFVSDGTDTPLMDPTHQIYTPTTSPGHQLPHICLELKGERLSTHDLMGQNGHLSLITDRQGGEWVEAAKEAAEKKGVGLRIAQITEPFSGVKEEEYLDSSGCWSQVKEVKAGGAILVRPGTIVGWRSSGSGAADEIDRALDKILGLDQPLI